ncbi:heavy metal translocating P-type ATPase, partial [Turicimonas muris]
MKDDIKQAPENGSLQPQTQKAVSHDSPENIKGNSETKMCNCGKYPGQPCRCLEDALKANSVHAHSQEHRCCGHHHETSETSSSSKSETECCSHEHGTHCCESHSHEHQECCSAHNHHEHHECHSHEHAGCGCEHHHEEKHEHHESHACCAEHVHSHDKHCCCGHDHSHVENSMDTDWNVSEVKPTQYKLLFATLGSLVGVHDVNLTPEGLRIIHTPESLPAIEEAFSKNNLKLKRVVDNKKQTSQIRIPQMDCPTEEGLIRKKLNGIEGVSGLQFNLMNRILTVSYLPGQLPVILAAIKSLEYDPEVIEGQKTSLSEFKPTKINWWRYIFCLILALGSEACELLNLNEYVSIALAVAAILFVGVGTYKKGFIAIKNLNFNMNALMAVAVTGAVLIGSWAEAAMVMVLFEISEAIEQLSLDKARGAIRSLLSMTPQKATVQKDGKWEEIEADDVRVGDTVRVEPGERLAVDGKVISGNSSLNQSAITGESLPVDKKPGDAVFAGSLNENSELIYEATSTAQNSMPARIISAIESAQSSRAPTQRFVDSFAKVYTPLVFLIALATAVIPPLALDGDWYGWIYKALTLLVIACPCALVISTPVTIVTGLANAAKRGILVKGGIYLEKGRKLQLIAFDKTGTITEGKPQVQEVEMLTDVDPNTVLTLAAALADRNSHPVSKAVSEHAAAHGLQGSKLAEVNDFTALPGQGVVGTIEGTEYYLGNLKGLDRYLLQSQTIR